MSRFKSHPAVLSSAVCAVTVFCLAGVAAAQMTSDEFKSRAVREIDSLRAGPLTNVSESTLAQYRETVSAFVDRSPFAADAASQEYFFVSLRTWMRSLDPPYKAAGITVPRECYDAFYGTARYELMAEMEWFGYTGVPRPAELAEIEFQVSRIRGTFREAALRRFPGVDDTIIDWYAGRLEESIDFAAHCGFRHGWKRPLTPGELARVTNAIDERMRIVMDEVRKTTDDPLSLAHSVLLDAASDVESGAAELTALTWEGPQYPRIFSDEDYRGQAAAIDEEAKWNEEYLRIWTEHSGELEPEQNAFDSRFQLSTSSRGTPLPRDPLAALGPPPNPFADQARAEAQAPPAKATVQAIAEEAVPSEVQAPAGEGPVTWAIVAGAVAVIVLALVFLARKRPSVG